MNQMQPGGTPDNDLQKAIDNIANKANPDATFSDPVAAPSSIPEGDNGELGEPVGPFPMPGNDPKVDIVTPEPEPIAPIEPLNLPTLDVSGEDPADATVVTQHDPDPIEIKPEAPQEPATPPEPEPEEPEQPAEPKPIVPAGHTYQEPAPKPAPRPSRPAPAPNPYADRPAAPAKSNNRVVPSERYSDQPAYNSPNSIDSTTYAIKKAILHDLAPLLERTNADPSEKFRIYRDTMEDLRDFSVLDQAYQAASSIQNEDERAEALLYLIESIDAM